jgi:hypothetical protein
MSNMKDERLKAWFGEFTPLCRRWFALYIESIDGSGVCGGKMMGHLGHRDTFLETWIAIW